MRSTPATIGSTQATRQQIGAAARAVEPTSFVDLGARAERNETAFLLTQRVEPIGVCSGWHSDQAATAPLEMSDRTRWAHRASLMHPGYCRSCPSRWPCETRLRLDEVCPAAQQLYAAGVDAGWLAGVPTRRVAPNISITPILDALGSDFVWQVTPQRRSAHRLGSRSLTEPRCAPDRLPTGAANSVAALPILSN